MSTLRIETVHAADAPMHLLLEADPDEEQVRGYLDTSECYVARLGDAAVAVYVLKRRSEDTMELMNIAVHPDRQRTGIGTRLLAHAIRQARASGAKKLEVGTGTFGYQLAFYQRAGFRADRIDRNFFLDRYAEPVMENGIRLKDMLRLVLPL